MMVGTVVVLVSTLNTVSIVLAWVMLLDLECPMLWLEMVIAMMTQIVLNVYLTDLIAVDQLSILNFALNAHAMVSLKIKVSISYN